MARSDPQLNVRIPAGLRFQLVVASKVAGRPLNQEVLNRLKRSIAAEQSNSAFGVEMRHHGYIPVRLGDGSIEWRVPTPTEQLGGFIHPDDVAAFLANTPDTRAEPARKALSPEVEKAIGKEVRRAIGEEVRRAIREALADERAKRQAADAGE